jgi:hypothetical protein
MRIEFAFPSGIFSPPLGRQTGSFTGAQFAMASPWLYTPAPLYVDLRTEGHGLASTLSSDEVNDWIEDYVYHVTVTNVGVPYAMFSLMGGGVT